MTRRNELLQALETTPRDLVRTLKLTDPTTRATHIVAGQWSLSDILNHLTSVEIRYLARLQRVAEETNPTIPIIHPDSENHNLDTSLETLLVQFTQARAQTLDYLRPISSGIWARKATFEDGRTTSFRYLVQMLVDHDTEHLNQLIETKAKLRPSK